MENRNQSTRLLLFIFLCLTTLGCGSEEATPGTGPTLNPTEFSSCETLEPQVFEDPLTGGAFHCLWCSREWKWTIRENTQGLFVLVALSCERLRSAAHLQVKDSHASVVWRQEVRQGDTSTYCIQHEDPTSGTWSLRLRGSRNAPLVGDLIEEFRGSVYLKVFNERGDPLADPGH
jgi:hypothetical protein